MPQDPCKCDAEVVELATTARCFLVQLIKDEYQAQLNESVPPDNAAFQVMLTRLSLLNELDEFLARCG